MIRSEQNILKAGAFLMFPFFSLLTFCIKFILNLFYHITDGFMPFILSKHFGSKSRFCSYPMEGSNSYDFFLFVILLIIGIYGLIKLYNNKIRLIYFILYGFFIIQALGVFLILLSLIKAENQYYISFFNPFKEVFAASTYLGLPYYSISVLVFIFFIASIFILQKRIKFTINTIFKIGFCFFLGMLSYYAFLHLLLNYILN
ncbi:MAG: hypothetical protein HKP48_01845 [Winogradskyella sp.]|uniref:hypothetical protein n=1 Tax=Winogradskyella sp. TaxID=1883156 RepID=UPI0018485CF3|nr:hypothetical protein [Winogradskyella sp.]MBT8243746.1 hypothetical protein [Winogradskyella sp.]NNK22061.1 hypothetical protein [Winogradskyella sp.]